jgi:hypothetical protein
LRNERGVRNLVSGERGVERTDLIHVLSKLVSNFIRNQGGTRRVRVGHADDQELRISIRRRRYLSGERILRQVEILRGNDIGQNLPILDQLLISFRQPFGTEERVVIKFPGPAGIDEKLRLSLVHRLLSLSV